MKSFQQEANAPAFAFFILQKIASFGRIRIANCEAICRDSVADTFSFYSSATIWVTILAQWAAAAFSKVG